MRVNNRDGGMLVDGNVVRHRWAECFDELLNVENVVHCTGKHCGGS